MKTIQVVAAIIHDEEGNVLATQRGVWRVQGMVGVSWWKDGRGREQGSGTRARNMGGTLCDDNA